MSNIRDAIDRMMDGKPGEASDLIGNELLSRARDQIAVRKIEVATGMLGEVEEIEDNDETDDEEEESDDSEDDASEGDVDLGEARKKVAPMSSGERNRAMMNFFAKGGKVTKGASMHATGSATFSHATKASATSSSSKGHSMDIGGDPTEAGSDAEAKKIRDTAAKARLKKAQAVVLKKALQTGKKVMTKGGRHPGKRVLLPGKLRNK